MPRSQHSTFNSQPTTAQPSTLNSRPLALPSRGGLWPARPPLRTVRESFPSYGSSRSNRCALSWAPAAIERRWNTSFTLRAGGNRFGFPSTPTYAPDKTAALVEVFGVAWVVGVSCPPDFEMALDYRAGQPIDRQHVARAVFGT